jgi:predicted TIM-barrel fold metal-dependent hydrolase
MMERYVAEYQLDAKVQATFQDLDTKSVAAGVDLCVVQAEIEEPPSAALNDRVCEIVQRDPLRYLGFAGIDPGEPGAREEVARALDELGLRGLNIQPWASGIAPNDPACEWLFEDCAARGVPLTVHTGTSLACTRSIMLGWPVVLDEMAGRFPQLTIVLNHGGWPWLDEAVSVAWRHPNVYIEFGAIAPRQLGEPGSPWGSVVGLMNGWLGRKVLFATDWPLVSFRRAVAEFEDLDLRPEVRAAVFGGNASRILGLAD